MYRLKLIAIICVLGASAIGCAQPVNDISQIRIDPINATAWVLPPVLKPDDNVDFYLHLPKRIVEWNRDENGSWHKAFVETDQYQFSGGHLVLQNIAVQDVGDGGVEHRRYEYRWEKGHLVEVTVSSPNGSGNGPTFRVLKKVVFHYGGGQEKSVDLYEDGVLDSKYVFAYDSHGNIQSYENHILSPFTQKWELSSRSVYRYDVEQRVVRIEQSIPGMDSDVTAISYRNSTATVAESDAELIFRYDNAGRLIGENAHYPNGEFLYMNVELAYDKFGRLIKYVVKNGNSGNLQNDVSSRVTKDELSY